MARRRRSLPAGVFAAISIGLALAGLAVGYLLGRRTDAPRPAPSADPVVALDASHVTLLDAGLRLELPAPPDAAPP